MTETLKTSGIDIQNNMQNWIKQQIGKTYLETNSGLQDLENKISNNTLENELTMEHVKSVLQNALNKFSQGKSFKEVYGGTTIAWPEGMWAWLVINIQIALKKLGIDSGAIDGRYGPKTKEAVIAFQKENGLTADGQAGKNTITKLLEKLGETKKTEKEEIKKIEEKDNKKTEEETKKEEIKDSENKKSEEDKTKKEEIKDSEDKKSEEETKKDKQETIIIDTTPESKVDHLTKIKEKFNVEPAAYITVKSIEQKNQNFVMHAKVYDKDISIVFDKDYINPVLDTGKDIFNLTLSPSEWNKQKLLLTKKATEQQTQEVDKERESLYKNAKFTFEANNIPELGNVMEIFDPTKITHFSLQLRNDIVNKETKVDVNGRDKKELNLKEDLNINNNNSIDLHFSKIAGKSIAFVLTIKKSDGPDKKIFTISSPTTLPGDSWAEFMKQKAIINKILGLELPAGWTKSTDKDPITLDQQNPKNSIQEPDNIHLNIVNNNNQKEQIHFDKDGKLLLNQELTLGGKTYLVSGNENKILFTEKPIPQNINNQTALQELITNTIIFNKPKDKEVFWETVKQLPENINNNLSNFLSEMKGKGFTISWWTIWSTLADNTVYSGLILESSLGISPNEYTLIKKKYEELFTWRDSLHHISIRSTTTNNMVKNIMVKINW